MQHARVGLLEGERGSGSGHKKTARIAPFLGYDSKKNGIIPASRHKNGTPRHGWWR